MIRPSLDGSRFFDRVFHSVNMVTLCEMDCVTDARTRTRPFVPPKMRPPLGTALAIIKQRSSMRREVPNSLPRRWSRFAANCVPIRKWRCSFSFAVRSRSIPAASCHAHANLPSRQSEFRAQRLLLHARNHRGARLITRFRRGITALIRRGKYSESLLR